MRTFHLNRNRTIILTRGHRVRLVCGIFFTSTSRIHLRHGEFVVVTCSISGHTITVACGSRTRFKGTVHLHRNESLIVSCS